MARVLVIPDSHLKTDVIERGIELAKKKFADHIVLLGDYFDDWNATVYEYEAMAKYLKNLLRTNPNVVPLYGNHELSYIDPKRFRASGYNKSVASIVTSCVKNDYRFLYAFAIDGVLYSHAGVTLDWIRENKIMTKNDIRLKLNGTKSAERVAKIINDLPNLDPLGAVGPGRGGSKAPGPLWADARELDFDPAGTMTQVVGHTPVTNILKVGTLWFTDVYSNGNECDEYLLVVDGQPRIVHYNEEMK